MEYKISERNFDDKLKPRRVDLFITTHTNGIEDLYCSALVLKTMSLSMTKNVRINLFLFGVIIALG